jgi:hypothetical protein
MKRCPTCQSTYTDDALRFCLQDGTPLVSVTGLPDIEKTLRIDSAERRGDEPPPTEILSAPVLPSVPAKSPVTTPYQPRPTETVPQDFVAAPPRAKNTALVIPVTIAATVLVLAVVGLGGWLLFGNRNGDGGNNARVDGERTTRVPATGSSSSPAATPAPATPSPTPTAAASPVNVAVVRSEVMKLLNGWTESSMARDLDTHMGYYADRLDTYYTRTNVSASAVRADRERAYNTYSSLDISLSNVEITPETDGERATAVFDKTWAFEGEHKATSGSVQQKLWLAKIDGRWRITGEKDLQVYYVNK